MSADWHLAKSLAVLRDQINQQFPGRDKQDDGTIGNPEHAARHSDHNPNKHGVVQALDITNDPRHGLVSRKLVEALIASGDKRLKYVISNRQIAEKKNNFKWAAYSGPSPHTEHCHISVSDDPEVYDLPYPWVFDYKVDVKSVEESKKLPSRQPTLKLGDAGAVVEDLQRLLNAKYELRLLVDGRFGAATKEAVVELQRKLKVVPDGIVGPHTRALIEAAPSPAM